MKWSSIFGSQVKYLRKADLVLVVFFVIILWILATQLKDGILMLSLDFLVLKSWFKVIATAVAIVGAAWMFRVYLRSVKDAKDKLVK